MAKRKTVRSSKPKKAMAAKPKAPRTMVQEALQVTFVLKGKLKCAQMAYLRIGELLVQVRDHQLYSAIGHATIESYAQEHLVLGKASLCRYIQVYDWVRKSHPEWLEPKPKGFIPELYDCFDLMWIEKELERTNLSTQEKAGLESLKAKGLAGTLKTTDLINLRRRNLKVEDGIQTFLSKLRKLRMRGSQLASMPEEVTIHLDAAISILKDHQTLAKSGFLHLFDSEQRLLA